MSNRGTAVLLAAFLLGLSALLFLQTFQVRNFPGTRFGAEIWPRAILISMGLLSVILLLQSLRKSTVPLTQEALKAVFEREGIAWSVFACFFAFLWLLPRLGAYPAGALFVFATLTILGPKTLRSSLLHLGVAVGSSVVLWVLFSQVLKVIAPSGRWWALL
ncbi:tripartite tricarboxylate transporter TctB family protein [Pacificibacter maritimus]|uniref:Tripartite tricarboxylate transporter TctB family protein n=1 Tax=Pacificibacter maritimus TaxID=762213 RepID=A0A3N4VE71_9RHOB|nr:tripartite tricarboxylate transporter TctB family protein [Pacificibacter maritimus]RPE72150.1 tripartite tricarboxylate transporter TctB family protein [Pacificibacter maritimus]